jgi:hypothetical protein
MRKQRKSMICVRVRGGVWGVKVEGKGEGKGKVEKENGRR